MPTPEEKTALGLSANALKKPARLALLCDARTRQ